LFHDARLMMLSNPDRALIGLTTCLPSHCARAGFA
jgi:hypothetical protein